ncbi:Esterase/lipase [Octadecabacter temperatus]|uniref:Alpha/beta hydrolase family protein n=1 Tax=Octadecabacter temperatus TaxID=1458307 RepID=A0A0K0Y3P9_9RHOB|nr:alpha/beta fold hydrolase [Octadecabacter temperatus]AKS45564.1 Alpha/beta hydrolase family protein [Octadecabacter temperatus]SIN95793.1 Esterase/lipase [Octadecabacter temperatus]
MLPEINEFDGWLAEREAAVGGVREGCAKQIVWAGTPTKTPLCIVYVHGFSATGAEVRPLPDMVAKALGANLYFARLTGHGQDGAAMGRARLPDWERDVVEALEIGSALGDDVVVIGCSTGCTLLTSALAQGASVKGVVHLSPNYGLRHRLGQMLLDLPGVRRWGPLVAGRERTFDAVSDAHAALWTIKYDTQAVFTMGDAVRACLAGDIEAIQTPAYFAFNEDDQVVSPKRTRAVMTRWAGPVTQDILVQGPSDDKMGHVMAGDVFSPKQTAPLADRIIAWVNAL